MKKLKGKQVLALILSLILVVGCVSLLYGNFSLDIQEIHIPSQKIPKSFHNYLIAHISDYHNRTSGLIDNQIFESLGEEKPDIIVITGDLVDYSNTKIDVALEFAEKLCEFAPVYYVPGNHESNINRDDEKEYQKLIDGLDKIGVNLLLNDKVKIENTEGDSITLSGIKDPYFYGGYEQDFQRTEILCDALDINSDEYNVLLAHHPETLSVYYKYNFDLVFSGHAHGGQVTLFGKAIMAPDQVTFPPYTSGLYKMVDTQLVLSRGIGYSVLPIRAFCRPHLIYAEFKPGV